MGSRKFRLFAIPAIVALVAAYILYSAITSYIIGKAKQEVQNVLLANRGLHLYIQRVMHPTYYEALEQGAVTKAFYKPQMLSSSYIVRVMHGFEDEERAKMGLPRVYYKMAASNPRNPVNKADAEEARLIELFNSTPKLKEYEAIVQTEKGKVLYYAIPFLRNEQRCLKCHSKREAAPPGLQALYPGEGGFNEKAGQLRAIESIRVPLDDKMLGAYIMTGSLSSGLFALVVLFVFNTNLRETVRARTAHLQEEVLERTRAEEATAKALQEKTVLLKEIHHRVKNNMAVISSLLALQSSSISDRTLRDIFEESRGRIRSMALVHEKLYQSADFVHIDVADYVKSLVRAIQLSMTSGRKIKVTVEVGDDVQMDLDSLVPCGLIINELLTNSFKYAFDADTPNAEVRVSMHRTNDGKGISLTVTDNGKGLPQGFDLAQSAGLGLKLVESLSLQLDGSMQLEGSNGTTMHLVFPEKLTFARHQTNG